MKKIKNIFSLLVVALAGLLLTACSKDDLGTNQYQGGVSLNVYGPSPVMRGGQLRFLGSNLDQIREVIIPDGISITNIEVVKSGVPSEIRVTIPKDGPVPGKVILVSKTDERITTKTDLNYIEGIEITAFPTSAMPGDVIKIEGDYLKLIYSLAFADNVLVSADDFVSHDRYAIEVKVPEEAKTGKLELYTADLTVVDKNSVEYQIIKTDEAIEIGVPTTEEVKSPRGTAAAEGEITAKAGEKITLTGSYYNVVSAIAFGDVEVSEIEVSEDGTTLSFVVPATAPDGVFNLVCKSGEEVPVATLTTIKPTNCTATPNPVKALKALTISGQDMDLVTGVKFEGADALSGDKITVAADKVVVGAVPETATEGKLKLVMANGATVDVEFTLVKPTVTTYNANPVSAGAALQITGTDLDLVKTIKFGDGTATINKEAVSADGTTITVIVPMEGTSGKPVFNLANGTSVEGPDLTIDEAVFCYYTELPAEDAEMKAGESFVLPVANGDKLTGVEINGEACQYVLTTGGQLIVGIPAAAGKNSSVRLISSNGEITYTFNFIPSTEVTTVLWTGTALADDWKNQPYILSDGGQELKDAGVEVGDIITFHITPTEAAWKIQFVEGHWGPTYASICSLGNDTESGKFTEYDLDANKGNFSIEVTQDILDAAYKVGGWGGVFVLNGDNVVVDKVTTTHFNSLETTLWEGNEDLSGGAQPYIGSDGGAEFIENNVKAGQTVRFYIEPTEDGWYYEVFEGHWGPKYAKYDASSGIAYGSKGAVELTLTQDMIDAALVKGGWGGIFVVQGKVILTKVTVE